MITATPGDLVWPSDNELGIPSLPLEVQATALDAPLVQWGSVGRKQNSMRGTWAFYVDDYRFAGLWENPGQVLTSSPAAIVEPNYSVFDQTPVAVAVWATYRKRWLARWWASAGARVWVDMNVSETHAALNLLGVPRGWQAYATRGYSDRLADLDREHALAVSWGAGSATLLVYGGGRDVADWCLDRPGAIHVAEGKRILDHDRIKREAGLQK